MFKRFIQLSLVLFAILAVTLTNATDPAYAAKKKPTIIPSDAIYRGKSYGEWAASWWQAFFAAPVVDGNHPYLNGGIIPAKDKVTFLAAAVASDPVAPITIDITIPAGTALFVPVINAECSVFEDPPFHGENEESLRDCANGHMDHVSGVSAKLDGSKIKDIEKYRVESPLFTYVLPENNLFAFFGLDAPAGTTSDAVDAGYYLLIAPLSVGEHKLRVRGTFDGGGAVDTTFLITVNPRRCVKTAARVPPCESDD